MSIFKFLSNEVCRSISNVKIVEGMRNILYIGNKSDIPDTIMYGDYSVVGIHNEGDTLKLYVESVIK